MLPVKLWFPLVLRNKNKTAEIKLFKSLYKRHRKIAVSFFYAEMPPRGSPDGAHCVHCPAARKICFPGNSIYNDIFKSNSKQSPSHVF